MTFKITPKVNCEDVAGVVYVPGGEYTLTGVEFCSIRNQSVYRYNPVSAIADPLSKLRIEMLVVVC